ncbi:MAG: stage II sporulation protein M [Chthoniobacteraceae bacterium]
MLFYNGVILGVVGCDYIQSGESLFLFGWLMPHGVIEIPSILIAGQAGLLLGRTLLGNHDRAPLRERIRAVSGDLALLIFGCSIMLVWAGIVESFLSQYHEPVIPYVAKIAFGTVELIGLIWFLNHGKRTQDSDA